MALTQAVRFRTELAPDHKSWLAVLLVYGLGALVLFTLLSFAIAFRQFDEARTRAATLQGNLWAVERLADDLGQGSDGPAVAAALARFHDDFSTRGSVDEDVLPAPRPDGTPVASARELDTLVDDKAPAPRIREVALLLATKAKAGAAAADQRASAAAARVTFRATILGLVVIVCVFGGGVLFLVRSRRLERLLAARASELDEVDSSRRLFFAKASHELRTPVTAMLGEAELALSDAGDLAAARETLAHIVANAKFLGHRIEEMIGLARTSDGKLHLDRARLDLRDVVASAVEESRSFAASVQVALDLSLPDVPVTVLGDGLWLKRALLAVIENALKFSPMDGRLQIALAAREAFAEVTVIDQGPGMMLEELPRVFEAYYQSNPGKARGGTGLGLAMTRWVAEQHGGSACARNLGTENPSGCAITVAVKRERVA